MKLVPAIALLEVFVILLLGFMNTTNKNDRHKRDVSVIYNANPVNVLRANINPNVNPCEDFYGFACSQMLEERENFGKFSMDEKMEKKQLWKTVRYLRTPIPKREERVRHFLKETFSMCTGVDVIDFEGLAHLFRALTLSGGFPLLDGPTWDQLTWKYWNVVSGEYLSSKAGFTDAKFIELGVEKRKTASTTNLVPVFRIPSSLTHADALSFDRYFGYAKDMIMILSKKSSLSETEIQELNQTVKLKMDLIDIARWNTNHPDYIADKSPSSEMLDLKKYKHIERYSLLEYFIALVSEKKAEYDSKIVLTNGFDKYFESVANIIKTTPNRVLANYIAIENIIQVTPFLTLKLRMTYNQYFRPVSNRPINGKTKEGESRDIVCAKAIKNKARTTLTSLYLQDFKLKNYSLLNIGNGLKKELRKKVDRAFWMDGYNKFDVMLKINQMEFVPVLPQDIVKNLQNKSEFSEYHEDLVLKEKGALNAYLSLSTFAIRKNHMLLDPNRRWSLFNENYDMFDTTIYYDSDRNAIVVPLGVLEFWRSNRRWPKYMYFGSLGSKVAREIISQTPLTWPNQWSARVKNRNLDMWHCFERQLNLSSNSSKDISEDLLVQSYVEKSIADMAALQLAYDSFRNFGRKRSPAVFGLKGLERYTADQLFFTSFAAYHCPPAVERYAPIMALTAVETPHHRYWPISLMASLKNSPKFSEAFQCPQGSNMNPGMKCKVW